MKTPILESKRIILRPLTIDDAENIYRSWTSDPEVAKFMMWDTHKSIDDTIEWLKIEVENVHKEGLYNWGFVLKETGDLFGSRWHIL